MGDVEIVDRGSREIVLFLSGDIDEGMQSRLDEAADEVDELEERDGLSRLIVDMQRVTRLGPAGVEFLRNLQQHGRRHGYTVGLSMVSAPAHEVLEEEHLMDVHSAPPPDFRGQP